MTRKNAQLIEHSLRARGVYKPFVSAYVAGEGLSIESYPLCAYITPGACVDPERGPFHNVKIVDCSLARLQLDTTIGTGRVFIGSDPITVAAQMLIGFHGPAHARAVEQDAASDRDFRKAFTPNKHGEYT